MRVENAEKTRVYAQKPFKNSIFGGKQRTRGLIGPESSDDFFLRQNSLGNSRHRFSRRIFRGAIASNQLVNFGISFPCQVVLFKVLP